MHQPGDQLNEAFRRLDLIQIGAALGIQLKPGAQLSPFRDEKSKSFSVFPKNDPKSWKDHGTDESGQAWKFVEMARPEWDKGQRAKFLIELSGQTPTGPQRMTKIERRERLRDRTLEIYRRREAQAARVEPLPPIEHWLDHVRERYQEGQLRLLKDDTACSHIGEERGWYDYTVKQLAELGKIAEPLLPWSSGARGVAFAVEAPKVGLAVPADRDQSPNPGTALPILGYHQRFITKRTNRHGTTVSKSWLYCPYIPGNPHTEFQIHLAKDQRTTPALPFFIGNTKDPSLIVILEGQWDAISFWAACCGEDGTAAPAHARMAVFGLRGASSPSLFLSAWGRLVGMSSRPTLWLLGDNDEAGRRWTTPQGQPGTHREPSFSQRLEAVGAGRLVTTYLKGTGIKDFNDWYAKKMPEPKHMARFFQKAGVEWVG